MKNDLEKIVNECFLFQIKYGIPLEAVIGKELVENYAKPIRELRDEKVNKIYSEWSAFDYSLYGKENDEGIRQKVEKELKNEN
jgi:hypothetical protein